MSLGELIAMTTPCVSAIGVTILFGGHVTFHTPWKQRSAEGIENRYADVHIPGGREL